MPGGIIAWLAGPDAGSPKFHAIPDASPAGSTTVATKLIVADLPDAGSAQSVLTCVTVTVGHGGGTVTMQEPSVNLPAPARTHIDSPAWFANFASTAIR